jgi:excisionase family DNA binding protein
MSYTLEAAATATGLNQTTILRAIRDGTIAGTKDDGGEWLVEAAELQRLYAFVTEGGGGDAGQASPPELDALGLEIEALLRQAGARLRQQFDDLHRARDGGHEQAQAASLVEESVEG